MLTTRKKAVIAAAISAGILCTGFVSQVFHPHEDVVETYTVKSGDTLWDIAGVYMEKNTYAPREQREFMHGIIEKNYDRLFHDRVISHDRTGVTIYPGDVLEIEYQAEGE